MRAFIAINLPESIKEEIEKQKTETKSLFDYDPVKWVERESLHITLAFLGEIREEKLQSLNKELETVKVSPFSISFKDITYIPLNKRYAKMIWVKGESEGLIKLQKKIETLLVNSSGVNYTPDDRDFTPHITLGRIKKWDLQRMPLSQIPDIKEEVNINFVVNSFYLMQSKLKRSGPQYEIIKEYGLEKENGTI